MQEKLYLGVKNHATGDYYVSACKLPVQIGKQHDVNNQILLDPKYRTISRIHGMIEQTSRGYVYSDSSANGSRVGGLVVRDSRVALPTPFQIDIENYSITKVEAQPYVILSTTPKLLQLQSMELLVGRGLGIADTRALRNKNPLRPSGINGQPGAYELIDLNFWTAWANPLIGRIELSDNKPVLVRDDFATAVLLRNKSPVKDARTPLVSLDVIEIDGTRLEVLHPHEHRIVCGNDRCNLLNPPPLEANCRFCGHHLANSGGFSRLL